MARVVATQRPSPLSRVILACAWFSMVTCCNDAGGYKEPPPDSHPPATKSDRSPQPGATRQTTAPAETTPEPPTGMRYVPRTQFFMGIKPGSHGMEPGREETAGPLFVDAHEVTVGDYRACVERGLCKRPPTGPGCNFPDAARDRHPINCVDWYEASRFCESNQKRLPTAPEWQLAARGTDGRIYPWGDQPPSNQLCWQGRPGALRARTCEVGSVGSSASPYGLLDLAGNVAEWTNTDQSGVPSGRALVVQGGGYVLDPMEDSEWRSVRVDFPTAYPPSHRSSDVGFRCARDAVTRR